MLCVCFDFHTSNIQRAQMKRLALCIVRLGNPISRPPEGRLDYGRRNDNTHNVTTSFFCATALFCVSSALFFHIFSRKRGWNQIATQRSGCNLERTSSEMYEFCRLRRNEEYGACEDEPAERRPLCRKPHRALGAYETGLNITPTEPPRHSFSFFLSVGGRSPTAAPPHPPPARRRRSPASGCTAA